MMTCQKSACLSHSQNDCSGKSDLNGECEWDTGMNKCLRKKSCVDNSDAETCNADPNCLFDDYSTNQCFTFDKLCTEKGAVGKAYCAAHDYTTMEFYSGACTWSADETCVPSTCAKQATKEKCEETCDDGVKCGWCALPIVFFSIFLLFKILTPRFPPFFLLSSFFFLLSSFFFLLPFRQQPEWLQQLQLPAYLRSTGGWVVRVV